MKKSFLFLTLICFCTMVLYGQTNWKMQPVSLPTRWTKQVSPSTAWREYPRPQMVRDNWYCLNGLWQFAVTGKDSSPPEEYQKNILVPYPVESALSGIKMIIQPSQNVWYKRVFKMPAIKIDKRVILHFDAVDWQATVYVNGKELGTHIGGYDRFSFDITNGLKPGINELVVKVYDPTDQGPNPHGKQALKPNNIWYTSTTGIWQTVWMETVHASHIEEIVVTPDVDKKSFNIQINAPSDCEIVATVHDKGKTVASAIGKTGTAIILPILKPKLWSPSQPFLYDIIIKLKKNGQIIDQVSSYGGMRKIEIKPDDKGFDRIYLNNKYIFNLGVLDQGFWPDGLYTAPSDEALSFDVMAIKSMGFNTIRKHIKREPDRWYYWCDKLGMMVWQDMINPSFNLNDQAKKQFEVECQENIRELYNFPSIIAYTIFNEKWGQYDQKRLTKWIKQLDPTRLINGHSGEFLYVNEQLRSPSLDAYVESDITDVHSYPDPMNSIHIEGKAQVLGEYGGIGVFIEDHQWNKNNGWGYINVTPSQLEGKYAIMNLHLKLLEQEGLSASIYTQPFDVEGEQNGLMTYDREVIKIPFERLRKIHAPLFAEMRNFPMVVAQTADVTDPGIRYARLLQEFINGNRDSSFLRKLSISAQQVNDKLGVESSTKEYFAILKKPFSKDDLRYILQVACKTNDAGFAMLQSNASAIDSALGERQAETKMMNIIYAEMLEPSVTGKNSNPDWNELSANMAAFGTIGEEILLRAKAVYYFNVADFDNFVEAADTYIQQFGRHIAIDELNRFSWGVFENVISKSLLLKAAEWSKMTFQTDQRPEYIDTYANLLYKAGLIEEAINMQEKAVQISGGNKELTLTLDKMKRGLPTWKPHK